MTNKQLSFFSMPFLRPRSRIMCAMDSAILIKKLLRTSRISFKVILMLLHPRKMTNLTIAEMREASLLLVAVSLSPIETMQIPPQPQLLRILAVPLTSLRIVLAPPLNLMPACQIFAINAVFVKIAMLNGLIAPCIILPLAPKLQRILMSCANPPMFPYPNHHQAIPPHHHVVSANATPRTTLMNLVVPNVVDCIAALAAVLTATPHSPSRSSSHDCSHDDQTSRQSSRPHHDHYIGHHDFPDDPPTIKFDRNVNRYISSNGSFVPRELIDSTNIKYNEPTSVDSPTSHTNSYQSKIDHSAWNTNPDENPFHPVHFDGDGKHEPPASYGMTDADYLDDDDDNHSSELGADAPSSCSCKQVFDICNYNDPETKQYSYWKNSKPDTQPPAGLMYFYVISFYCKEIALLDDDHHPSVLHQQDIDRRAFLTGMCQLYHSLTSRNEPDIFDINRDQKLELNQYIHFAQTNWDARQAWYRDRRRSAINKNSPFIYIP